MQEKQYKMLLGLASLGFLIGLWGLGNVIFLGKRAVAYGSYITWGLEVAVYLFFLALTAGAFLITILTFWWPSPVR
jgi:ABC-type proline/glycine betaine transport system permease subunit